MPQLGETVTEGTVIRWCKQVGERIAVDEALLEVSTDKVDAEVPSPIAGEIVEILVAEGDTVPIGARLAVITESEVETKSGVEVAPSPAPATAASAPVAPAPAPVATAPPPAPPTAPPARTTSPRVEAGVVPFSNIRKRTAENLTQSLRTSAHTLVAVEVDYEAVNKVRRGAGLTYLPFVMRAIVDALSEFPRLNASVVDDALVVHGAVHLGIAVDLDFEGLVVPVIRDAQDKTITELAAAAADLALRAHAKRLTADDLAGGTFTITNAGGYGTLLTGPIINQPQVGDRVDGRGDDAAGRGGHRRRRVRRRRAPDRQPCAVVRPSGHRRRLLLGVPRQGRADPADPRLEHRGHRRRPACCEGREESGSRAGPGRVPPRRAHGGLSPSVHLPRDRRPRDQPAEAEPRLLPDLRRRTRGPAPRARPTPALGLRLVLPLLPRPGLDARARHQRLPDPAAGSRLGGRSRVGWPADALPLGQRRAPRRHAVEPDRQPVPPRGRLRGGRALHLTTPTSPRLHSPRRRADLRVARRGRDIGGRVLGEPQHGVHAAPPGRVPSSPTTATRSRSRRATRRRRRSSELVRGFRGLEVHRRRRPRLLRGARASRLRSSATCERASVLRSSTRRSRVRTRTRPRTRRRSTGRSTS